jgi:hypothetical protein
MWCDGSPRSMAHLSSRRQRVEKPKSRKARKIAVGRAQRQPVFNRKSGKMRVGHKVAMYSG